MCGGLAFRLGNLSRLFSHRISGRGCRDCTVSPYSMSRASIASHQKWDPAMVDLHSFTPPITSFSNLLVFTICGTIPLILVAPASAILLSSSSLRIWTILLNPASP